MSIEENSLVRILGNKMNNDYYQELQVINVDKLIEDVYLDPCDCELSLECLSEYEDEGYFTYDFFILEAFDKTYIGMSQLGDTPSIVYKNKDGTVLCCSGDYCIPDLQGGYHYVGDECTVIGKEDPYESDSAWLWDSVERNPKVKTLGISKKTMNRLMEVRKEDLIKLEEER